MTKRCVIVPTFDRSELLFVCLEHIRAADPSIEIHVFPDRGTSEREVCSAFDAIHHLTIQHSYHGNSFVMLEALRWAFAHTYSTIYIVEDDAFVSPDFFSWCDAALAHPSRPFAACAWRYSPDALPPADGPDISIPWYLSVAAALPRTSLPQIVQHARPEYYSDMRGYLDTFYPQSSRRYSGHFEQDGLVLRVAESQSRSCVWPRRPRATHAGWWGYHMPSGARPSGSLADRVAIVRLLAANPSLLQYTFNGQLPPNIAHCADCHKPLLTTSSSAILRCVDCFHRDHPDLPRTSSSHYYFPDPTLQSSTGVSPCLTT